MTKTKLETWIVFDTETTDLVKNKLMPLEQQPHVIEFASALFTMDDKGNQKELSTIDFLCYPGFEIKPLTTQLTGISKEMLWGTAPFVTYVTDITAQFAKADIRAAHNLTFDEDMIDFEYERAEMKGLWRPTLKQRRVCTVEATEHIHGRRMKLSELFAEFVGKTHEGAHRALVDVRATCQAISELRKRGIL